MVDRPCAHQRLGGAEELLHLDQVAVSQDSLQRRDPGIGAQHEQAVVSASKARLVVGTSTLWGGERSWAAPPRICLHSSDVRTPLSRSVSSSRIRTARAAGPPLATNGAISKTAIVHAPFGR